MPAQNQPDSNYLPPNSIKTRLGHFLLKLLGGWAIEGELPRELDKYVIIIAHHTSNWDFIVGLAVKLVIRIRARFFIKRSFFFWPLGAFFRNIGGVPVVRSKAANQVGQAVEEIKKASHFVMVITPEGTRAKVTRWRTGFYHIARGANIPVVPVAFNFRDKKVVMGKAIELSGDLPADFDTMHRFFLEHPGKFAGQGCNGAFDSPGIYDDQAAG